MGPQELVLIVMWLGVAGAAAFAASALTRSRYRLLLDTGVALVGAVVGGLRTNRSDIDLAGVVDR